MGDIAVIGIGNILRKDDGMGVHVINHLEKGSLPSNIRLVDGGTAILNMLSYFIEYNRVIIVDCLKGGLEPGTIYKIKPEDISSYKKGNLSIHDVQILDVVKMANMLGKYPQVTIIGIEPKEIGFGLDMSEIMNSKISEVVKQIKNELKCSCPALIL